MTKGIKAVINCRVSTPEQGQSGYSLDSQEKLLRDYAEKNNMVVEKVYRITESASGKQIRKTFDGMLLYTTKHGIPIILCEKIDRLTRNLKDASTVDDWVKAEPGREVHFVKESFVLNANTRAHENLVWDMKVAISRFYSNNLSEEVRKGHKEKLAQGWLPSIPPIGYHSTGESGHKIHIIDEKIAPYVRMAFELYATGNYSLKKLREKLFNEGFRSRNGRKVVTSTIERLLKEPFYHGAMRWNGAIHPNGQQEPLISKELFDKVNDIMARKTTPKYGKHAFTFKKMLTCASCGGGITGEIQKGHVYYHCNHYRDCNQKVYTREEDIENQIIGVFEFFKTITPDEAEEIKDAIKTDHAGEAEYKENSLKALSTRYETLQKRIDRLYDDRLDEKISPEMWERRQAEINAEQQAIRDQMERLKSAETQYFEIWLNIIDLARRAREIYQNKNRTPEERRMLLGYIFAVLKLQDRKVTHTLLEPVEKLAKRVQERLDAETFEPTPNAPKSATTSGLATISPASSVAGFSKPRKKIRTSKSRDSKGQLDSANPKSRISLAPPVANLPR